MSVVSNAAKYRGGDNDASKDNAYNTLLGRAATALDAATFGSYARKKGDGWEAYWYTFPAVIGILLRIIMGDRNAQKAYNANKDSNGLYQGGFGAGVTGWSGNWASVMGSQQPFLPTSVGIELGDGVGVSSYNVLNSSGAVAKTFDIPVFFGLKNFFGYLGRWERGCLINKVSGGAGDVYVVPRLHSSYSMSSLSGLIKVSQVPAAAVASQWGFIQQLSMQNLCHKPTVTGSPATESTYYADGFYNDNAASGLRVPYVGGNANNGGNYGPEYVNVNNAVSASNVNNGSPLNFSVWFCVNFSTPKTERDRTPWWKINDKEVLVNVLHQWHG